MYGKEKVLVRSGKSRRLVEYQFFSAQLRLQHQEWTQQMIRNGATYVLPFTIQLPDSLPASDMQSYHEHGYRIQYKIQAWAGMTNKAFAYVNVHSAPLPDVRVPGNMGPLTLPLNSMAIVGRGRLFVAGQVQDTHIGRGEYLKLDLACRNESTAALQKVKISLVEHYKSPRTAAKTSRTLFSVDNVTLPGLDRTKKSRDQVRENKNNRSSQEEAYGALHRELLSGQNRIHIQLPLQMRDTYYGRYITVYHTLVIDWKTEATVTNPSLSIPLRIGNPPVRTQQEQPPPPTAPHHFAADLGPSSAPPVGAFTLPPEGLLTLPAAPPVVATPSAPPEALVFAPQLESIPNSSNNNNNGFAMDNAPVPIVDAMMIPDDASVFPVVNATDDVIFLGDDAVFVPNQGNGNDEKNNNNDHHHNLSGRAPLSALSQSPASLDTLRNEMLASINDYDIISRHLRQDESWRQLLANLSPADLGSILACVHIDFDQPRVAELLAQNYRRRHSHHHHNNNNHPGFTCAHLGHAVRNTAEWARADMVIKLLPYCVDVATHQNLVRKELNDWQRTVTEEAFARASCTSVDI